MPTTVKCIWIFRSGEGYGWSEVHYWLSSSDNPDLVARLNNMESTISPYRRTLLGADCAIIGLRASYPTPNGIASQPRKIFLPGPTDRDSASQNDSLACLFVDTTNTKRKITHLRGPWQAVIFDEAYHPEGDPTGVFAFNLASWKNSLIASGYGWPSRDPAASASGTVNNYTVNVDGTVTLQILTTSIALPPVGKQMLFRFSRINKSKSVLNRTLVCNVDDATHLTTVNQIAAGPFQSKGHFSMPVPAFLGYREMPQVSLGERRMGKNGTLYPGRRKVRATT